MKLINLVYASLFFILLLSCSKTFSGALIEKKNTLNDATYISADGPTYKSLELGRKVDFQIYIAEKEDSLGLVVRASYEQLDQISLEKISIINDQESLEFECSKRYTSSFVIQQEECDALVELGQEDTLEQLVNSEMTIIIFQGQEEGEKNISFTLSPEQKKAFGLVLNKYREIKG